MDESKHLLKARSGFTLLEVVLAAVIGSVIAGGTMIAFVTALNISHRASGTSEAAHLAQQTIERFRNRIACDDGWFDPATCAASGLPAGWQPDGGLPPAITARDYQVTAGCNGEPDCVTVQVRVQWTPPS